MRLRPLDFVAAGLAVAAIVFASLAAYGPRGGRLSVVVSDRNGEAYYPLGTDREIAALGPLGTTTVEIHGDKVHVTDSPCKNKICIAAGDISAAGQWIACLPNKVFVRIEGKGSSDDSVDAATY